MTYLSFTALSKLIAVIATYPYRLMRTRMQDQHHEHNGAIDILIRTWRLVFLFVRILDLLILFFKSFKFRYEGIRGFYKGMLPTLLRVTPATAITFVVYENISQNLIQNSTVASKSRIAIGN
jgi:solute carrier family 25 folate transporter 32